MLTADGRLIVENDDHTYPATIAAGDHVAALREFFRQERDTELARWRWPENPDYVVYPVDDSTVNVLHEPGGDTCLINDGEGYLSAELEGYVQAGDAYFDAHPEPKPWHDAKPGEVWVVTIDGHSRPHYVEGNRGDTVGGVAFVAINPTHGQPGHVGIGAPAVTDASRIYPEGD
jgi:hypothetical protein